MANGLGNNSAQKVGKWKSFRRCKKQSSIAEKRGRLTQTAQMIGWESRMWMEKKRRRGKKASEEKCH